MPVVDVLESQSWPHQGDAYGWLVIVVPAGFRPEKVILRNRKSGDVEKRLALKRSRPDDCYVEKLDAKASVFETAEHIVIAQGPLYKGNGPRIGKRYRIEVVLVDDAGAKHVAEGTPTGLCSVVTE